MAVAGIAPIEVARIAVACWGKRGSLQEARRDIQTGALPPSRLPSRRKQLFAGSRTRRSPRGSAARGGGEYRAMVLHLARLKSSYRGGTLSSALPLKVSAAPLKPHVPIFRSGGRAHQQAEARACAPAGWKDRLGRREGQMDQARRAAHRLYPEGRIAGWPARRITSPPTRTASSPMPSRSRTPRTSGTSRSTGSPAPTRPIPKRASRRRGQDM